MSRISLKLFIAGDSVRSDSAVKNLKHVLDDIAGCDYELTIIDVLEEPQLAEEEFVLATPTLIKSEPNPQRRIIGDLSDREALLLGLDLLNPESGRLESKNEVSI